MEIIELRSKLDWCLPNIAQCHAIINDSIDKYLYGNDKIKKHRDPINKGIFLKNKVVKRFETEHHRLPFMCLK